MLLAIGLLLIAAGVVLLLDLGGAARFVIRRLTSRSLGELAPGYAASRDGFRVYAGLAISPSAPLPGAVGTVIGIVGFLVATGIALMGEVRTYRDLPKKG